MPVDSGGRPPKATDGQPPPPDSSRKGSGDQQRSTDKSPSTSQADQSSKQSNFDKYLANPRQGSDQSRKGDDGTKAEKVSQARNADGGKAQPGGAAPPADTSGAKPQGDKSPGGGVKPEGQLSSGTKPECQPGDKGSEQRRSGGDSTAGVRSEGGGKPEGQSGGGKPERQSDDGAKPEARSDSGRAPAERPARNKMVHEPDGRRTSVPPETKIKDKQTSKETSDLPARSGRWADHLLEANREQRKQQLDERYDAVVKRDVEARKHEEERAHRLVQEQSQMVVPDGPPGIEKVPARAAAFTMLWNYLSKGIKPNKEDWLNVGDAAARGARSRGGVRSRPMGVGTPKPAPKQPAKTPGPSPKPPAKPTPPTGGNPGSGKPPDAPSPKPPADKRPTSKPTDARQRADAGKSRDVQTKTGKKLTDRVWLGGARLAERATRRANGLAEAAGVGAGPQKAQTTIGVLTFGRKVTKNGITRVEYRTIVTTNNPKVENAIAKNLRPGERLIPTRHEGKLTLHAEHNAVVHATTRSWIQRGWRPIAGGASNHVCARECQPNLTPLGAVIKGGGYYFPQARKALGIQ